MKLRMSGKKFRWGLAILFLVWSAPVSGAPLTPLAQVQGTVQAILAIMQDPALGTPANKELRRDRIMALVDERFDFAEMAKLTLARNWKARSREEKDEFQKLFADLLKHNYIGRIEAYSDEKVEYAKELFSQNNKKQARVYTIILKNGHKIPINYSLLEKGDEWFVYDVVIEGVSLVRNYRTEFDRIINKEDFPGLVKRMREKIESNEASDGANK